MSQNKSPEGPIYDGWVHNYTDDQSMFVVELFNEAGGFMGECEIPRHDRSCYLGASIIVKDCTDLKLHPPKIPKIETAAA